MTGDRLDLYLLRIEDSPLCTRGVLLLGDFIIGLTLELPWKENRRNVSRIPSGAYVIDIRGASDGITGGIGLAYEVKGVEGRSDILIHVGNTTDDIEGCILVGDRFGILQKKRAVLNSRSTYKKFMKEMDGREGNLTIIDKDQLCFQNYFQKSGA